MVEDRHVIEALGKVRVVIENGEITDAKTIIAIFYALRRLNEA